MGYFRVLGCNEKHGIKRVCLVEAFSVSKAGGVVFFSAKLVSVVVGWWGSAFRCQ